MTIDDLPWKAWLWIAVKALLLGGLIGAICGGWIEWLLRSVQP